MCPCSFWLWAGRSCWGSGEVSGGFGGAGLLVAVEGLRDVKCESVWREDLGGVGRVARRVAAVGFACRRYAVGMGRRRGDAVVIALRDVGQATRMAGQCALAGYSLVPGIGAVWRLGETDRIFVGGTPARAA